VAQPTPNGVISREPSVRLSLIQNANDLPVGVRQNHGHHHHRAVAADDGFSN